MTPSFFRRSSTKASAPDLEVAAALKQLDQLARERPSLSDSAGILRAVLPAAFGKSPCVESPALSREQAAAKMAAGVPLLRGDRLHCDRDELQRRWQTVWDIVARRRSPGVEGRLRSPADVDPAELLHAILGGEGATLGRLAERLAIDSGLVAVVFRLTLFPMLTAVSAVLWPLCEGLAWEQGYCPICGSPPVLGELRGLEQSLFLRCGLCAGDWPFPRLRCPFCGTRDHHVLGFLSIEGEEDRRRAATCDTCHGYVKLVSTLSPLSPPDLLVAELTTLHLDLVAAEQGYANTICS